MKTKIYGASDDLVEIDGEVSEEHDCYDHKRPINITVSDGTKATIFYDGEWTINVKKEGDKFIERVGNVGDYGIHEGNAEGCSSYSDVLVLDDGIEWVKVGGNMYKL